METTGIIGGYIGVYIAGSGEGEQLLWTANFIAGLCAFGSTPVKASYGTWGCVPLPLRELEPSPKRV